MAKATANKDKETHAGGKMIEPLFNPAFIRIFGREASKPLTRGLVNAVLRRMELEPVDEIERIEGEHTATEGSVECKTPRMDVRLVTAGRAIDLEAQCYPEDLDNRSLLYGAQLLCENTPSGAGYDELPQVVVITLLDAPPLFPKADDFFHTSKMAWSVDGGTIEGTDRMLFAVIELAKIRKRYNQLDEEVLGDELLTWSYLLTKGYAEREEVERMEAKIPDIGYFAELYGLATDDPKVKRAYEDAVSAEREYRSRQRYFERLKRESIDRGRQEGLEKGMEEGLEKGLEKGISAMSEALRAAGVDDDAIMAAAAAARSASIDS